MKLKIQGEGISYNSMWLRCVFECALETGAQFKNEGREELWRGFGRHFNAEDGVLSIGRPHMERCISTRATRWKKNQLRSAPFRSSEAL